MNQEKAEIETKPEIQLTERQTTILREEGLPESYSELSTSQQRSIMAIEEMLSYLEEKYEEPFSYDGYIKNGPVEEEHLLAYPSADSTKQKVCSVYRTDDGFRDDYMNVALQDRFSSYLADIFSQSASEAECCVFCEITSAKLDAPPQDSTDFNGKVESKIFLFVDDASCPEDGLSILEESILEVLKDRELYGTVQFVLLHHDSMKFLTDFNYTDYLDPIYYSARDVRYLDR